MVVAREESAYEADDLGEDEGGRCPVPEWALRLLAFALPVLAVIAALWFVLHH